MVWREALQYGIFAEREIALAGGMIVLATAGGHGAGKNGVAVPGLKVLVVEGGQVVVQCVVGDLGEGMVDSCEIGESSIFVGVGW